MRLSKLELITLAFVISVHLLAFLSSFFQFSNPPKKAEDVLQAELIPPPQTAQPEKKTPEKKSSQAPLLTVAPEKKPTQNTSKSEPAKDVPAVKNPAPEPISELSPATNITQKSAAPPASNPSTTSQNVLGVEGGAIALNQLIMVYKPDTNVFYPRFSKEIGERGIVEIRMQIDEGGSVTSTQVISSSGYARLDRAASELTSRIRFRPHLINGVPSKINAAISIKFELNN
jgi:protein TonB